MYEESFEREFNAVVLKGVQVLGASVVLGHIETVKHMLLADLRERAKKKMEEVGR